jgi:hypothetical protein
MVLDMQAVDIAAGVAPAEVRHTWQEVIVLLVVAEPIECSQWIGSIVHTLAVVAGMVQQMTFSIEVAKFVE